MPTHHITKESGIEAPQFAIVAKFGANGVGVRHIAILCKAETLTFANPVAVFQSGPRLEIGQLDAKNSPIEGKIVPDLVAWLPLDNKQNLAIATNLEEMRTLLPNRQLDRSEKWLHYVALPHYVEPEADLQGVRIRCSCVGFVWKCLEDVFDFGELVSTSGLPDISLEQVRETWADLAIHERRREEIGLHGNGPWPVLLPGYYVHACAIDSPTGTFEPTPEHRNFPA